MGGMDLVQSRFGYDMIQSSHFSRAIMQKSVLIKCVTSKDRTKCTDGRSKEAYFGSLEGKYLQLLALYKSGMVFLKM